ncbi:hypothetical protein [Halarcobacter sp.]|uniref:hypothetical protein n=1 Tax=Halarcobacter sp. TaxID=2321133 RepID=UPI002AA6D712|nr:hypothetical protein [Halarcobacter sp.]
MTSNTDDELTLDKIEDYNGKESKEKRNIVKLVVVFCLAVGAIFAVIKSTSSVDDYIGTKEAPGIITTKQ